MKAFGPEPWGLALGPDAIPMCRTPVGALCGWCHEAIEEGDAGISLGSIMSEMNGVREHANHRECFVRRIAGSVQHQLHECTCYGGRKPCEEDPQGLTRRQAARAALVIALDRVA